MNRRFLAHVPVAALSFGGTRPALGNGIGIIAFPLPSPDEVGRILKIEFQLRDATSSLEAGCDPALAAPTAATGRHDRMDNRPTGSGGFCFTDVCMGARGCGRPRWHPRRTLRSTAPHEGLLPPAPYRTLTAALRAMSRSLSNQSHWRLMQQLRSNLTRIKTKIETSLPEGGDIFGYKGISRDNLIKCISDAHSLTASFDKIEGTFPIVSLKRKLSPLFESCKKYIEEDVEGKQAEQKFNDFVNSITRIHDEIYLTYIIYSNQSIRNEAELNVVVKSLDELKAKYSEINPEIDKLMAAAKETGKLNKATEETSRGYTTELGKVTKAASEIEEIRTKASASVALIEKLESSAKETKKSIDDVSAKATSDEKRASKLITDTTTQSQEVTKLLLVAESSKTKNESLLKDIEKTIKEASKYGMAASFKQRKDELRWSMVIWGIAFVAAMAGLVITGAIYVLPGLSKESPSTTRDFLVQISILAPQIWLGWMAAKQFGYLSRIREDYSFKYASALAFEGYKKEALEVNKELMNDLLEVATTNMSLNPLRIYTEKSENHASPLHEIAAMFRRTKEIPKEKGND